MGQRRERQSGRPRKPGLPDPRDPKLRAWVLGLEGPIMHRETCARLRPRGFITVAALAEWTFAGFPGWPANQSEMPLSIRLRLAERLSMTSPLVRVGRCLVPLLPPGALVNSPRLPAAPTMDTPEQRRTRDVLSAFQRALVHEWWQTHDADKDLLTRYERLREIFAARGTRSPTLWRRLGLGHDKGSVLLIEGKRYSVPSLEARRGNPNPEPGEAAHLFLEADGHGNERSIRRRLTLARISRKVGAAWDVYRDWLCANPWASAELEQVLPSMTRDVASRSGSLSSPPLEEKLAP